MTERIELPVGTFIGADWAAIAALHTKMARVMGRLSALRKDARHQQGWTYVSYSKVADAIREAMADENLAVYVGVSEARQTTVQLRNSEGIRCNVKMQFTFADGDTGALCVMPWESEALDTGIADKGLNKAYTAGEKYLLMRTFLVSSSDDIEPDADDEAPEVAAHNGKPKPSPRIEAKPGQKPVYSIMSWSESSRNRFYARWQEALSGPGIDVGEIVHQVYGVETMKSLPYDEQRTCLIQDIVLDGYALGLGLSEIEAVLGVCPVAEFIGSREDAIRRFKVYKGLKNATA